MKRINEEFLVFILTLVTDLLPWFLAINFYGQAQRRGSGEWGTEQEQDVFLEDRSVKGRWL